MGEHMSDSRIGTDMSTSNTYLVSDDSGIPYFDRSALITRSAFSARGPDKGFHYDLLTFISLAAKTYHQSLNLKLRPSMHFIFWPIDLV